MTRQVAVRLPEDLVDYMDQVVARRDLSSRAAVVSRALERDRRRAIAARDAEILSQTGPDPELSGLAEFAADLNVSP